MSPPFGNIKKGTKGASNQLKNENRGRWRREQKVKIGHHITIIMKTLLLITSVRLFDLSELLVMMVLAEGECPHVILNTRLKVI